MTFLQALASRAQTQVVEEHVDDCRACHKECTHSASDSERKLFFEHLVGKIHKRCKQHGEENKHKVVPKVLSETFRTPNQEVHEKSAHAHDVGDPKIEPHVLL